MRMRIMTLIFTEECPLRCRYCFLERDKCYGKFDDYKKAEVWAAVSKFYNSLEDDEIGRICFSGGEPLLYFEEIKKIIMHYGNKMIYELNTSAYLLTLDMLDFFSDY